MSKTVTKFSELEGAFLFVNSAPQGQNTAYLCLATGEFHWHSEFGDNEGMLPNDLEDPAAYIEIPHKNELDLGKQLVLEFVAHSLPNDLDDVDRTFRRRGAYGRFKALLEHRGKLEEWHEFELQHQRRALREWCEENDIELED